MKIADYLKNKPLHFVLLPSYFVIKHFFEIVTPEETGSSYLWVFNFFCALVLCIGFPFLLFKTVSLKWDIIKSGILTSLLFFPFFFFQDLFVSTEQYFVGAVRIRWLLPLLGLLVLVCSYLLLKSKRSWMQLNEYLNMVSVALLVYILVALSFSFDRQRAKPVNFEASTHTLNCQQCPNIYLFVLDSYTSNKSLRDYFHFDNSDFINKLNQLNFEVPDEVISPYAMTIYSMSAVLNFSEIKNPESYNNPAGLRAIIRSNSLIKSLSEKNYNIQNFSLFDIGDKPKYYSLSPVPSTPSVVLNGIAQNSILNVGFEFFQKRRWFGLHNNILETIRKEAGLDHSRAQFIYAHIMAPHPPFVINENGSQVTFSELKKSRNNAESYVNQVRGLNRMMITTLTQILNDDPGSVIILMGDHGYRFLEGHESEGNTVFLAYHGPQKEELNLLLDSSLIFDMIFKNLNNQ